MSNPMRRTWWSLARLRVAVWVSLVAGLDATISNVSPPAPIRGSAISIFDMGGTGQCDVTAHFAAGVRNSFGKNA